MCRTSKADAGFATILDGNKIRASKRLFTTATPRYFGKAIKDEAKARDLTVIGMDDEAVFGPVIHKLTFGQAIHYEPEPLLNDYQVVIVGVDPRGSQVEIIRAVGRAISKVRGGLIQKKGTIVLPVFIEDGDDPEASIEASQFQARLGRSKGPQSTR
jgi:predicted helicase